MLISVQTEPTQQQLLLCVCVAVERERECLNSSAYPNIFPVVFLVDFLSSGRCIISKHRGKQVVFLFLNTPVLHSVTKNRLASEGNKSLTRKWQ